MSMRFSWMRTPERRRAVSVGIALLVWCSIYGFRTFQSHLTLRTNAFDLSVFDYALWSTGRIGLGYVPFLGQSLFSHHFMPTLLVLWPAYQIIPSPLVLIALQLMAFAVAAVLLYRLMPADLAALPVTAIIVAFLFGRRSHSAVTSVFYIESLEPLLIFLMVLAWRAGRHGLAIAAAFLAVGCKEDMAVYVGAFGASVFLAGSRRAGTGIVAGSLLWFLIAVGVAVPESRAHDHLPAASPFIDAALGSRDAVQQTVEQINVWGAVKALTVISAGAGFLCWLTPELFLVALPGFVVTVVAKPAAMASGLSGHYLFPVLPWVFAAAAAGAGRLQRAYPAALTVLSVLLLAATVADSPLWRGIGVTGNDAAAGEIRRSLQRIPPEVPVLAMPNLVPHLAHRKHIATLGGTPPAALPDWVAISAAGDLWPLDPDRVRKEIQLYASDPRFETVSSGPLHLFRRVQP